MIDVLRMRILVAIGATATLTACGSSLTSESTTKDDAATDTSEPATKDGATPDDATTDTSDAGTTNPDALPPVPDVSGCGPDPSAPEVGPCCEAIVCFAMDAGACPTKEDAQRSAAPGSGYCSCGSTLGPFRGDNPAEPCCYAVSRMSCLGRPLRVDDVMFVAPAVARVDWSAPIRPTLHGLTDDERARLSAYWQRAAAFEHASIASFARFAIDLMTIGAPPDLIDAAHQAARDEIVHARASYALASAYAGHAIGPGPLSLPAFEAIDLVTVAVDTVRDGCVGETLAAARAAAAARECRDPVVRGVLETIAEEELQHAELAWRFVRFAIQRGGASVASAVARAFAIAAAATSHGHDAGLPERGVLSSAQEAAVDQATFREVIAPSASLLTCIDHASERHHAIA